MQKKKNAAALLIPIILWAAVSVVIGGLLADSAHATTARDIVFKAREDYGANVALMEVIPKAFDGAREIGVSPKDISASLAQAFMETANEQGQSESAYICTITTNMLWALGRVEPDQAEMFRAFSQSVQGMRAAASQIGLDSDRVQNLIKNCVELYVDTEELRLQLARIVENAYQEPYASTYLPAWGPPERPSEVPSTISDAYDPTASSTR